MPDWLSGRAALFVLVAGLTAASASPLAVPPAAGQQVQVVDITAERFSFTPSEVRTTTGTTLEIRLRSDDTAHGFRILGTDVDIELPKRGRGEASVTFTPARAGRYTFECSRVCGAGHSFMRGAIVVSDPR